MVKKITEFRKKVFEILAQLSYDGKQKARKLFRVSGLNDLAMLAWIG